MSVTNACDKIQAIGHVFVSQRPKIKNLVDCLFDLISPIYRLRVPFQAKFMQTNTFKYDFVFSPIY